MKLLRDIFRQPLIRRIRGIRLNSTGADSMSSAAASAKRPFPIGKSLAVSGVTMVGLWAYYRSEKAKLDKLKEAKAGAVGAPKIGGPFTLTDHTGKSFAFPADCAGAHSLIYFGFTHCPDVCPEELEKISEALGMLGEKVQGVKTLFVTCDPDRDTPPVIAEYLKDFHPSIIGVTGEMDDVKAAAKLFRVYFKAARTSASAKPGEDYLVDHSIFYYLMDPEGRYVTHFGRETRPEECAAVIKEALAAWERRSLAPTKEA